MQLEISAEGFGLEVSDDDAWTIHTDVFDGPLDLLLYLVRREGIDLLRLPVARIADSYLAYLDRLRALNLGIASDYLVMAATLVYLKSLELLPRPPTPVDEEALDPREELARRLRDHARLAQLSEQLEGRPQVDRDVFVRRPASVDGDDRPLAQADPFALLDTYHAMLTRRAVPAPRVEMSSSGPDLGGCCLRMLQALGPNGRGELGQLLLSLPSRAERVVTFLATLEMARLGWITVMQTHHLGPAEITRLIADDDIDVTIIVGFDPPRAHGADDEDQLTLPLETR
jgi:segregation and condensation protein A